MNERATRVRADMGMVLIGGGAAGRDGRADRLWQFAPVPGTTPEEQTWMARSIMSPCS
jgi:hypothetical protein